MHNLYSQLIDMKLTIAAILFSVVTFSDFELSVKFFGGIIFIGYNIRRWFIMEKKHKNETDKKPENETYDN